MNVMAILNEFIHNSGFVVAYEGLGKSMIYRKLF